MPRKCNVPGCTSNYNSNVKLNGTVTTFYLPKHETRKQAWIRAWKPTSRSAVCANHFNEKDIIVNENWKRQDGTVTNVPPRSPKLTEDAVSEFATLFK